MVAGVGLRKLGDVGLQQEQFAPAKLAVGLFEADPTLADRLDLAALQHEARLELLEDLVLVPRATVALEQLVAQLLVLLLAAHGSPGSGNLAASRTSRHAAGSTHLREFAA